MLQADVLVIGSGAAGMYAAITAARAGAKVLLVDRSLIGRGGATVMAQMTVAVAVGEEEPDHWEHHLADTLKAGRGLCDPALSRLLCEQGPACIREMDEWGIGWARRDGHLAQVHAPGHDRKRCVYVDFLNTGPAVSKTLARPRAAHTGSAARRRPPGHRARRARWRLHRGARDACVHRRRGTDRGEGDHRRDRRTDAPVRAQQRLDQHGRRRLRARIARRRRAHRHGVRAVLSDRPPRAAAGRHGPDHVGPVPLQAGRPAAQRRDAGVPAGRGPLRRGARPRHLRHPQGSGRGPRLAARRRMAFLPALQRGGAARRLRTGHRPPGGERHRPHAPADRSRADRALPHGRHPRGHRHAHQRAASLCRRRGGRRCERRQSPLRQRDHRGVHLRPARRRAGRGARRGHEDARCRATLPGCP